MEKGSIIVIEGPQGVGKSTMANYFRDNLSASNLYRLTGIKDKSITGLEKTRRMYLSLIEYMKKIEETELNLIFDRTFFTEEVYSNLGYKEYSFHETYNELLKEFSKLNYNIYFIVLYLKRVEIYEQRLKRVHHNYQAFSIKNSIDQQEQYLKILNEIEYENINKIAVPTDDFDTAYQTVIQKIPVLSKNLTYNKK